MNKTSNADYTKTVTLVKGSSEIEAHLSRGRFYKVNKEGQYEVSGEFGRRGERCVNNWHGDYREMKTAFFAYVGGRILDGYLVKSVKVD